MKFIGDQKVVCGELSYWHLAFPLGMQYCMELYQRTKDAKHLLNGRLCAHYAVEYSKSTPLSTLAIVAAQALVLQMNQYNKKNKKTKIPDTIILELMELGNSVETSVETNFKLKSVDIKVNMLIKKWTSDREPRIKEASNLLDEFDKIKPQTSFDYVKCRFDVCGFVMTQFLLNNAADYEGFLRYLRVKDLWQQYLQDAKTLRPQIKEYDILPRETARLMTMSVIEHNKKIYKVQHRTAVF